MKLLYVEVVSCSNEPNQKVNEESLEKNKKEKIRYDFDYRIQKKEILKSGKEHITNKVLQGKSKVILKPGLQFLEISDGVVSGNYWMCVEATHQKIGK